MRFGRRFRQWWRRNPEIGLPVTVFLIMVPLAIVFILLLASQRPSG